MEETKRSSVIPIGTEALRLSETNARLLEYWLMLKPWVRRIIATTVAAVLLTFICTHFLMTPWYQAEAVIRPASQEGPNSPTANWIGSAAGSTLAALGAAAGFGQAIPNDASEFMLMMESFGFTTDLAERHHLEPILFRKSWLDRIMGSMIGSKAPKDSEKQKWANYLALKHRFQQDYDDKLGNLTITFIDPDRGIARKILGYYIEDLRDRIRNRALHDTATAVASLEDELDKTSDPMIRTQIARLAAQQIEQEKMAQAQADFAFTVVEPPFFKANKFTPKTIVDCILVGLTVPLMFVVCIVFYHRVYLPIRETEKILNARSGQDRSEQDRITLAASKR